MFVAARLRCETGINLITTKRVKMKKLLCGLLLVTPLAHATITADVKPYESRCLVAQPCQVGAIHWLRIINDTNVPQTYDWYMSVSADNGDVVKKNGRITLQPGQEWRQDKVSNIGYMKFNMKGRKMLHCASRADGYEHAGIVRDGWADVN